MTDSPAMSRHWLIPFCAMALAGCEDEVKNSGETEAGEPIIFESLVFTPEFQMLEAEAGVETVEANFQVRNSGSERVTITGMETNCACLKVGVADTVLDPREETKLSALFEVSELLGESEKVIRVSTSESTGRVAFLPVRVRVPEIFSIEPKNLQWLMGTEPESKIIRIRILRDEPVHVTSVKSSRDSMKAEWKEIEKGKKYEITVIPESTDDYLLGFITIETDLELERHRRQMAYMLISDEIDEEQSE
ncbi:MAG: DUF1573 domain-containing protein [Verrucomicrobiales bacterium]|nr:DUF1573 domain-containing protein [Verrucomicrobiales bacterium]